MTKLRGYLALLVVMASLVALDPVQRFALAVRLRLAPSRRIQIMTRWQRMLAHLVLNCVHHIGGAKIPALPRIHGREDTLVLMNHQSVLDIPLMVASLHDRYPRIITRKRYLRWIPLISHMVRLYQYPVVDPRANSAETKKMLAAIRDAARTTDVPLGIFPEGTRTRNGEVGPFRPTGLKLILRQRPWTVYVLVADGFWQRAKLKDFMSGMSAIRGDIRLLGPFAWTDPKTDSEPFMDEMRTVMVDTLAAMRAERAG